MTRKKYDVEISVVNNDKHSSLAGRKRTVKRTKSFDVLRKSSLAAYNQHLTAARSHSLDYNKLPLRRKVSRVESPLVSEYIKKSIERSDVTLDATATSNDFTTINKLNKFSTKDKDSNPISVKLIGKAKGAKKNSVVPEHKNQLFHRRNSLRPQSSNKKVRPESPNSWALPVIHKDFTKNGVAFENPLFYSINHSTANGSTRKYYTDIKQDVSSLSIPNRNRGRYKFIHDLFSYRSRVYSLWL